jgi:pimeloyl-ACP methyl ester carboxylesterase
MWGWIVGGLVVAGAAGWPLLAEAQRKPPDRLRPAGQMVQLSQGATHIRWSGPARGPVAVLVHGLTSPLEVWDQVAGGLAATGYRVLTYDLYGRGLSDAPRGAHTPAFHARQLGDVLASQGLAEDVTLIGYSMGGAIATAYAGANPQQVKRLVLIAPAGITLPVLSRRQRIAAQVPVIGDALNQLFGPRQMRSRLARPVPPGAEALWAAKRRDVDRAGIHPAILSDVRHTLSVLQETEHRALGRANVPVHAIWAEEDTDIPVRGLGQLAAWNRAALQEVVPEAGHSVVYTHAADIVVRLRQMLLDET